MSSHEFARLHWRVWAQPCGRGESCFERYTLAPMRSSTPRRWAVSWECLTTVLFVAIALTGCGRNDELYLNVQIPTRQVSKVPFIMAMDQGLYKKHGLNVELVLPDAPGGINTRAPFWKRVVRRITGRRPSIDLWIDGHTPNMVLYTTDGKAPRWISLAATDCSMRYVVVARSGIDSVEDLRGRRLGFNHFESTTGATGFRLLKKMGWVQDRDITVVFPAETRELEAGKVDAIVTSLERFNERRREDLKILLDTNEWNEAVAGNSVLVAPGWLDDPTHQEAARRFLRATVEAVALFRERRDVVLDVMQRWNGMPAAEASARYDEASFVPRVPFPCYAGVEATMELYDSPEMRTHKATDFYDDRLMRELERDGFVERTYAALHR